MASTQFPVSLRLNDSNGDALTKDQYCNGMFTISPSSGGSQTAYFYIEDGRYEIVGIRYAVSDAVTLAFDLQTKMLGAANWQDIPAHKSSLAADGSSQDANMNYPLREVCIPGMAMRAKCVVSDDTTIGVQVLAVLK